MNRTRALGKLVDVSCRVARETADAVAIAAEGTIEVFDRETREPMTVRRWIWLPKKHIAVRPGKIRMPEWLAKSRGLI